MWFRDYKDVQMIMSNANMLRGKEFSINRDYQKVKSLLG